METWTMRLSEPTEQDLVSVLVAAPRDAFVVDASGLTIDLADPPGIGETDVEIIGRVHTGADAVERALDVMPDVLVLDARVSDGDARSVCRQIQEWAPATRVLVISPVDDECLYAIVASGASSALTELAGQCDIEDAAYRLARGESIIPARAARRLLNDVDAWAARSSDPLYPPPTLTSTEREVLAHISVGECAEEIAAAFGVTSHLVNMHMGYAVAKLHRYVTGTAFLASIGA